MRKSILIISALGIWSMGEKKGAPTIQRTIEGYLDDGWNVIFITGSGESEHSTNMENLTVLGFDSPYIKRLLAIPKIGFLARILWWLRFQLTAIYIFLFIDCEVDIVYGYETMGVPAGKIASWYYQVPLVGRYQGTKLLPRMGLTFWQIRFWDTILAYKVSTDLTIMTNDGTMGDVVLTRLDHPTDNIKFLMNGVDWKIFDNSQSDILEFEKEGPILLTVSRLVEWKHVDRAIFALPDVVEEYPDVTLMIVGDGPELSRLEMLAEELGVRQNVYFVGAVPHREIPAYLNQADVFLSLFDISNVGNPLLEAMVAGTCIVTLDTGATETVVKDGENGVLLSKNELSELPEVLTDLLDNTDRRKKLGFEAKAYARREFWGWDERLKEEIDAVEGLLDKQK